MIRTALIGLILLCFFACSDDTPSAFPDFSACNCSPFPHDIVCGDDGRTYLDSCFAECLKVTIISDGNCPDAFNDPNDTMKWPIEVVCIPVILENDPMEIRILGDGSVLYRRADGSYFRGTQNMCRCLPPEALIRTPWTDIPIELLHPGDPIVVVDKAGVLGESTVDAIRRVPVLAGHQLVRISLDDGRQLSASPMHPMASGRLLADVKVGDCVDRGLVERIEIIPFDGGYTWDLLPAGHAQVYLVNGIPVRSTMSQTNRAVQ